MVFISMGVTNDTPRTVGSVLDAISEQILLNSSVLSLS